MDKPANEDVECTSPKISMLRNTDTACGAIESVNVKRQRWLYTQTTQMKVVVVAARKNCGD
jgi:hypothetical protein